MDRNEILNQVKREIEPQVLEGYFDQILINRVVDATLKAINYSQCCKSDSEQLLAVAKYVYWNYDESSSKKPKDYLEDFESQ